MMTMADARQILDAKYETDDERDAALESGELDTTAHNLVTAFDRATRVDDMAFAEACEEFSDDDRRAWRDDSAFAYSLTRED